jgi:sugar phosphate isomerase/epimerase
VQKQPAQADKTATDEDGGQSDQVRYIIAIGQANQPLVAIAVGPCAVDQRGRDFWRDSCRFCATTQTAIFGQKNEPGGFRMINWAVLHMDRGSSGIVHEKTSQRRCSAHRAVFRQRGGARVTAFDLEDAQRAVLMGHDGRGTVDAPDEERISTDALWKYLESLLKELVPVAEDAGVVLAMHPDDPPLPEFLGKARIMNSIENFERLVTLVPSLNNAICFCQGTFAEMGVDIPAAIERLGSHIRYVHFRDVRGTATSFTETFHDNGPTDMVAAMRAYRAIGFDGPIRPDHVPQLAGEEDGEPGYTMKGRLFAFGYLRGLMQATEMA